MKMLTLLRHAKSSWDVPGLSDKDRPLNERGERDAPMMAKRLQAAAIRPSLIVCSPAARALATARALAEVINYPMEFLQREPDMYLASRRKLVELLARQDEGFNSIVMVGHNPGLTEFANYLLPGLTDNIPTCGLVSINVASEDWDVRQTGDNELLLFDYPKKPRRQTA